MFDPLSHRRVAFVALAAFVVLSGAVASAPATADVSPTEIDGSPASMAETTTSDENVSAEFVYEGERLVLEQSDDQMVRMRTNADPGTELTVELRVDGNFVAEARAPVAENGTATAALDMRQFDPGTEFALVAPDGSRAEGEIVEESNETTTVATTVDESEFSFTTAATTTATDAPTDGDDTTDRDDSDGIVPGFGVPAALAALLAVLALARRRGA